ncbi:MAG: right-handed parallel beta-helix repeat-containing protein [Thermoguttaceae bacterium]|nr:right-handed parallel beta-helix repeat-containing protein [Thermoguttaceae bacterium]MDO4856330.1 right-handed parallel beta-helix repeat-containing protein [Thermoguttaceae bacterium]
MLRFQSFFLIFFLLVSCAGLCVARDIYVDNVYGNDDFAGHSPKAIDMNGPVRTIKHALEMAHASDRIILANNPERPYRESLLVGGERNSGMPGFPFRIKGNGATIDGSAEIPPEYWHAAGQKGIFYYQPRYMEFQNLFFRGKPCIRLDTKEVHSTDDLAKLDWKPMRWALYDGRVYFLPKEAHMVLALERLLPQDDSETAKMRAYAMTAPEKRFGITFFHAHHVDVEDLVIQGFQNDGVNLSDAATYISLKNVTVRGNARYGVTVGTGSSVWLKDCVLGNNQIAQLYTEEAAMASLFTSDLIAYPAPGWIDQGGMVFIDKKQVKGGFSEVTDSGIEDEDAFFFGEKAEESEVQEETIGDDDDDDEKEDSGNDLFGGDDDDDDSDNSGGDDDDDDDSGNDLFGGDDDDDSDDDEDSGGFDMDEDSDDDNGDDDSGDDDDDSGFSF